MPKIAASMIFALRDSRRAGDETRLVTYFCSTVIQGFPDLEEKKSAVRVAIANIVKQLRKRIL